MIDQKLTLLPNASESIVNQSLPNPTRFQYLEQINSNAIATTSLFNYKGELSENLISVLRMLPLIEKSSGKHLIDSLRETGKLNIHEIETYLQDTFYKKLINKFSFELAEDGEKPTSEQKSAFTTFGLTDEIRIQPNTQYDAGVVFGGLLGAIDARTRFLIDQKAQLSCIGLLGGERSLLPDRELGESLVKVIGQEHFHELTSRNAMPTTEYELMLCIWDSYCKRDSNLRDLPVLAINSDLRLNHAKAAPGTPDTVVDFANTLSSGIKIPGLTSSPSTFLLSSSQPHALRQREDFVSVMALLNYPRLEQVDVVGYANQNPSLLLYSREITNIVHTQYISRYDRKPE